jgi:hypothetical protein
VLQGDAAADAWRQILSPAGLLGRESEHRPGARILFEKGQAVSDRILPGRRRQFVHEAFGDEDVVRWPDAAPERSRNAGRLHLHIFHPEIREGIDQVDRALDSVRIEPVLETWRKISRDHRGAGEAMVPGDRPPLRVQARRDPVVPIGPVHVVLDVFLSRPDDLDRTIHLAGDLDGANDAVDLEAPSEAAADEMIVDHDAVERQAGGFRRGSLDPRQRLAADPDLAAVPSHVDGAVHRLHCSTLFTRPPNTGDCASVAIFTPAGRASMP